MYEDKYKIYIPKGKLNNWHNIAFPFTSVFKDEIKLCDSLETADYLLHPFPENVMSFVANPKFIKMSIEEFFIKVIPKKPITEEEKENVLMMLSSNDKQSQNLAIDIIFSHDMCVNLGAHISYLTQYEITAINFKAVILAHVSDFIRKTNYYGE